MNSFAFRPKTRSLMAVALTALALSSAPAFAAPHYSAYASELPLATRYADKTGNISDFQVEQPDRYAPGNRLIFTVRGEPRSKVTVQIQGVGVNKTIALNETDRGVYEGAYTVRPNENYSRPTFRAQLIKNKSVSTAVASVDERALRQAERRDNRNDRNDRDGRRDDYRQDPRADSGYDARDSRYGQRAACQTCGVIESVQAIDARAQNGSANSPLGVIGGAVVGGLLGNQVGSGSGRDLATIAGVIGGGFAGNEIARSQNGRDVDYVLTIRMDNGQRQQLRVPENPNLAAGARVRLDGNRLLPE